jgi:hypothetical protein
MNPRATSARTLAQVTVVAAAAQLCAGIFAAVVPAYGLRREPIIWFSVLLAVLHLGQVAAAVALARSELAGPGRLARAGLTLWITGGLGYVAGELLYLVDAPTSDVAFQIGSLASGIGLVLAGIAVLRTGHWQGPGRVLPLVTGGYVFVVLVPVLVATPAGLLGIGGWSVLWLLLGLGLLSTVRERDPMKSPHASAAAGNINHP